MCRMHPRLNVKVVVTSKCDDGECVEGRVAGEETD